jgi:uncharacterized small protein (DUF1192 family)
MAEKKKEEQEKSRSSSKIVGGRILNMPSTRELDKDIATLARHEICLREARLPAEHAKLNHHRPTNILCPIRVD